MKSSILFITFCLFMFISCSKQESNAFPVIPEEKTIDLDNDGEDDYIITYSQFFINTPTAINGYVCALNPIGDNKILRKSGASSLFLEDFEEIKENVISPNSWSIYCNLANLDEHFEDGWPSQWKIAHNEIKYSYFIGMKLSKSDTDRIGYIEITFDRKTAEVAIFKKKLL